MTNQNLAQALAEASPERALELLAAAELALPNDVLIASGLRDGALSSGGIPSGDKSPIDDALRDANAAFVQCLIHAGLSERAAELLGVQTT